jgi:preprotein translocase subunit SecB
MADEQAQPERQLVLQKIYIKDFSFESPKSPEIFTSNVNAETQLNIRSGHRQVDDQHIEVTLTLTVKSQALDTTVFLIELVQAGVFQITGYTQEELSALIGSFCPGTLYPFAREAIADIANKGGFPQLLLQPINFDALYAQGMRERAAQAAGQPQQPTPMTAPVTAEPPAAGEAAAAESAPAASEASSGNGEKH